MKIFLIFFICILSLKSGFAQPLDEQLPTILGEINHPDDLESFSPLFHFEPINQDTTYVCWSFSTLSFVETEMKRVGLQPVKLSMMFPVYYGFLEKAKLYVQTKGTSRFTPGDLFMTPIEIIIKYGIVPLEIYRGETRNCRTFNHNGLYNELEAFMEQIKSEQNWNETAVLEGVTVILDKHLGSPPDRFQYKNEDHTPLTFAKKYVRLPWSEYILVTSFMDRPFNTFIALDVPDNWRKSSRFFNVPLDQFYEGLRGAVHNGYSVAFNGDIGEPGRFGLQDIAVIPGFDIPATHIDQNSREYRFKYKITQDDHLMHIVGYQELDGQDWLLVKDSWRDAWEGKFKGYFFYREDFVRLKVLAYMVHKDAIPAIVKMMHPGKPKGFIH